MSRVEKLRQAELARREAAGEPAGTPEQAKKPEKKPLDHANAKIAKVLDSTFEPLEAYCESKEQAAAKPTKEPPFQIHSEKVEVPGAGPIRVAKKKFKKMTPAERDAATKGKRRFPVKTEIICVMTGPEEWVASVCTPDGFMHAISGPGIHGLLSKLDDAFREWLRAKELSLGEQGGV